MKFSEDYNPGSNVIQAYDENGININGQRISQSVVIGRNHLHTEWPVDSVEALSTELLQELVELAPEVILIGTGERIQFPHPQVYAHVVQQGVGIEFMDSGAACRTYNILLSEDREVIAGIIL
jgi:uncharacterized protein